jgi:hypothetical protein
MRVARIAGLALFPAVLVLLASPAWAGQAESSKPEPALPEAPQPQVPVHASAPIAAPCPSAAGAGPQSGAQPAAAPCPPVTNWYQHFINGPQVKPLTPKEKARLAMHNVLDPFNGITILADAGIAVGSNAHSSYGPGMHGFGRYVGVSFTQDLTGEFFGAFLIPSIVHQDPHYHRMPNATIPRRVRHAIAQVLWTQGDNAEMMVNYANLAGFAIDVEISNLYVPARKTDLSASGARYSIALASAPIDNFVSEFMPDVARHIHVQVVVIQRIINHVARTEGPGQQ